MFIEPFHREVWKCPICGQQVSVSQEDFIEVGTPYCSDCDIMMEFFCEDTN